MRMRPHQPAESLMAWASHALQRRRSGQFANAPDWLCPQAVQAIELPLAKGSPLLVALRDGVSARFMPERLGFPGGPADGWPVRYHRRPPARAHAEAPGLTLERGQKIGTATALVRDCLAPIRQYLLTCAHVVAPDRASKAGDAVNVEFGGVTLTGCLREWQPNLGEGCPPSTLDAALVEVDAGTLQRLLQALERQGNAWLPNGVDDTVQVDRPVALQRSRAQGNGALGGRLASFWSGEVLVGDDEFPDYFLREAIGYRTDPAPQPGDSGAAVWTVGDMLLGMHVAGIEEGSSRFGANAVLVRARPAFDWFALKPWTRNDPATVTEDDWPKLPRDELNELHPPPPDDGDDAKRSLLVLTQTLWAETRGEPDEGMEAVARVILNRFEAHWRGARSIADVCLTPKQFSCWNPGDPNRAAISRVTQDPDDAFRRAQAIARRAMGFDGPPIISLPLEVRHYYAVSMPDLPPWARGRAPFRQIGRHVFYADIA